MRLYEFETKKIRHSARSNLIMLRYFNQQKRTIAQQVIADEMLKPLLAAMYGHLADDSMDHEVEMRVVELEQEKIELAKKMAELENIRAEPGEEAYQQIRKLSRSAMRQRKK